MTILNSIRNNILYKNSEILFQMYIHKSQSYFQKKKIQKYTRKMLRYSRIKQYGYQIKNANQKPSKSQWNYQKKYTKKQKKIKIFSIQYLQTKIFKKKKNQKKSSKQYQEQKKTKKKKESKKAISTLYQTSPILYQKSLIFSKKIYFIIQQIFSLQIHKKPSQEVQIKHRIQFFVKKIQLQIFYKTKEEKAPKIQILTLIKYILQYLFYKLLIKFPLKKSMNKTKKILQFYNKYQMINKSIKIKKKRLKFSKKVKISSKYKQMSKIHSFLIYKTSLFSTHNFQSKFQTIFLVYKHFVGTIYIQKKTTKYQMCPKKQFIGKIKNSKAKYNSV
ncbi:hypothetical protein IMG5_004180 [Ichthyophthirius multifiliis]|uniref:Uncharacterized protein n=1 Tax=Ichthyophthirius multifiliis TaxID=5932 RepID=G0QJD0_ICHMU|nr:hypothetical protein IMG5_004180 [Ichthyophthirius multifiliis]EGR34670.1 hypothetical protein IMG5_004180 [Ichthyophthirius multifiliis]|eukprot:XP_004039974.1 hypothetical protein IMG5_004180 [Ichthyophthirius multifiliis]